LVLTGPAAAAGNAEDAASATVLTGESESVARRLEAAAKLATEKKLSEALDDYLRILEHTGNVLVPLDGKRRRHCIQARRLCHLHIAALPAAGLKLYRTRVDDQLKKTLREAVRTHDRRTLGNIVEKAFCSKAAEPALELLGDLAFERGDFDEARRWWRLLAVPVHDIKQRTKEEPNRLEDLMYPDPEEDRVARVRAKHLIAQLFQGEGQALAADLKAFRQLHGKATGHLAGTQGNYADIVQKLIEKTKVETQHTEEETASTFAGKPSRNLVAPSGLPDRIGANGPAWVVRLDSGARLSEKEVKALRQEEEEISPRDALSLAFHPVVTSNLVLWADARYVNANDLLTGRQVFRYDLCGEGKDGGKNDDSALGVSQMGEVSLKLPARAGLRYTLTVADGRVYARLGCQALSPRRIVNENNRLLRNQPGDKRKSFLVCLDVNRAAEKRQLWQISSPLLDTDPMDIFEGAPLVANGRVYAVLSRLEVGQTKSWITCYDAEKGTPLWKREVCETRAGKEPEDGRRYRHHLLTLAGTNVVYCSHAGAIVAVDAVTGNRSWAMRYASRGPLTEEGDPSPRDLAPCVYSAGLVYAAPLDSDRVFCLNADTGRLVWERNRIEVVHLLGVSQGRLLFTTPDGIRAVGATNKEMKGWSSADDGKLPGFGRGLLAGRWVYWPTALTSLFLKTLEVEDGFQREDFDPSRFHNISRGNMTFGNGCLVITETEHLSVYVPEERFLQERKRQARKKNAPASAFYRLALAEAGANLTNEALADFARAEQIQSDEPYRGRTVRDLARQSRHDLLLRLARVRQAAGQWDRAARLLREASAAEFPGPQRVGALCQLAEIWSVAQKPERAVAAWQSLLTLNPLRRVHVDRPSGALQTAGQLAAARIADLVRRHGAPVYQPFEKQASRLLASAEDNNRVQVLEQLARDYPNAAVTGPALLRLARLREQAGQSLHAARAYRLVLAVGRAPPLTGDDLVLARVGLARAYERQDCWTAARAVWQDLAKQEGDRVCKALDGERTVHTLVAKELNKSAYTSLERAAALDLSLPLFRSWNIASESPRRRLLVPENSPLALGGRDVILMVQGGDTQVTLHCREAGTGKLRWEHKLPHPVTWSGFQGRSVLVAGSRSLHSLCLADGKTAWECSAASLPTIPSGRQTEARLSEFRLTRTRFFCLLDERRLLAFDVQSGRVVWSHWAPGARLKPLYPAGRFHPLYHAGERWVLIHTGSGTRLVIDSETGRIVHEARAGATGCLRRPVRLDERRVCLVPDAHRVLLFDLQSGKPLWTYRTARSAASTTPSGEAPQIYGNQETILVLVPRNFGYQLERVSLRTGRPAWKDRARILGEACDPGLVSLDRTVLYYVSRKILCARSLATGRLLWSRPVGGAEGPWRAVCVGQSVLAYPTRPALMLGLCWVPLGGAVMALPVRVLKQDHFAVLCCDAKDGRLVQRLNFPGAVTEPAVQFLPNRVVVEAERKIWGLKDSPRRGDS
jgi:outer membrane protein assembly factor BamB/tetratricopeptide (TPR) repeat protein